MRDQFASFGQVEKNSACRARKNYGYLLVI
jgi:hypothetical protein